MTINDLTQYQLDYYLYCFTCSREWAGTDDIMFRVVAVVWLVCVVVAMVRWGWGKDVPSVGNGQGKRTDNT